MQDSGKKAFEDVDFAPSTPDNMQTLYRPQDIVSAEEAKVMKGLKWLRPRQISMKSDLVGFTKLNTEAVNSKELDELLGKELADFHRISYGEILENRWLLNAASLVA